MPPLPPHSPPPIHTAHLLVLARVLPDPLPALGLHLFLTSTRIAASAFASTSVRLAASPDTLAAASAAAASAAATSTSPRFSTAALPLASPPPALLPLLASLLASSPASTYALLVPSAVGTLLQLPLDRLLALPSRLSTLALSPPCGPADAYARVGSPPHAALASAHTANCSSAAAAAARLAPTAAATLPLTSPRSLAKWRGFSPHWWAARANASRAAAAAAPHLFSAAPPCASRGAEALLSLSTYADPTPLYTFLRSLREAGARCDVFILTPHPSEPRALAVAAAFSATLLPSPPLANQRGKNGKYALLAAFARGAGRAYARLGFADLRDAYFQADPFAPPPCASLLAATETAAVRLAARAAIHADHTPRHCDTRFASMAHLPPVNSGAFFGDRAAFLAVALRCAAKIAACGAGYDQATFTEAVYQDGLAVTLTTTEHGRLAHLSLAREVRLDARGAAVDLAGEPYALVHQFDRFAGLVARVRTRFPIDLAAPPFAMSREQLARARRHDHASNTAKRPAGGGK
ncbi:hypothetical protein AB1Y20_010318 [Prymnesium parvum]|uniref:Uncharacterized protein n=1 Tax=Prymnesium parvum TaxID=97485 RepID=A0AB34K6G0_PRYPA